MNIPKNERLLLLTLGAIQFTHIMDFMIIMPLGPLLMRVFDINPQQFSLIVSAYTFSGGIFSFIGAFFLDNVKRKSALVFCYIGFIIGTLACAISPSYEFLLSARILTGAFGGILTALILSIIGDAIPMERRGTAMGIVMASFSVASVIGVPFGLFMAAKFNWHMPFYVVAVLGIPVLIGIYAYVPMIAAATIKQNPKQVLQNVFTLKNQYTALIFMVVMIFGQFTVIPFISPYMVANVGFTEIELTYIYLLGGGATIFTSPLIGRLSDKYGKHRVFTISMLLSFIPILLITNMPSVHIGLALVVTTSFFIISGGRMIPATALVTSAVRPENRGSFMSVNSSVQQLASGAAALVGGLIIHKNANDELENYPYVGIIALVAGLICIVLIRRVKAVS
jgi:predicted MFS family arabinose efflux permease